jgi:hypothetical protein
MFRSIYVIEGLIYLILGLLGGLLTGESGGFLAGIAFALFFYLAYLFFNRIWNRMMSGFGRIMSIIFTSGSILVVLVPGDLIRRLAFAFYQGDGVYEVAFGDPLSK